MKQAVTGNNFSGNCISRLLSKKYSPFVISTLDEDNKSYRISLPQVDLEWVARYCAESSFRHLYMLYGPFDTDESITLSRIWETKVQGEFKQLKQLMSHIFDEYNDAVEAAES